MSTRPRIQFNECGVSFHLFFFPRHYWNFFHSSLNSVLMNFHFSPRVMYALLLLTFAFSVPFLNQDAKRDMYAFFLIGYLKLYTIVYQRCYSLPSMYCAFLLSVHNFLIFWFYVFVFFVVVVSSFVAPFPVVFSPVHALPEQRRWYMMACVCDGNSQQRALADEGAIWNICGMASYSAGAGNNILSHAHHTLCLIVHIVFSLICSGWGTEYINISSEREERKKERTGSTNKQGIYE